MRVKNMMKYNGLYWLAFAPLIKRSVKRRFGAELARRSIKNGRTEYKKLLAAADPIGDGNPMAMNAYFAYVFVGAWLGSGKEIPANAMGEVMADVLGVMKPFFALTDLNRTPKKWEHDMKKYEKWCEKHDAAKNYPTAWKVNFDESRHKVGSFYYFSACPICATLKRLGLSEIMPGLCATDEIMFRCQHGVLHRDHTIAGGADICDYWVVGDKTKNAE